MDNRERRKGDRWNNFWRGTVHTFQDLDSGCLQPARRQDHSRADTSTSEGRYNEREGEGEEPQTKPDRTERKGGEGGKPGRVGRRLRKPIRWEVVALFFLIMWNLSSTFVLGARSQRRHANKVFQGARGCSPLSLSLLAFNGGSVSGLGSGSRLRGETKAIHQRVFVVGLSAE